MFTPLLESRSIRRRAPAGFAASVVLHGILLAGAVIATSRVPEHTTPPPRLNELIYFPPVPPPQSQSQAQAQAALRPDAPQLPPTENLPNIINVPIDVPVGLPPINPLRTLVNTDLPTQFRPDAPTRAGTPGITPLAPTATYSADQVEVPVVLDARSPLPRFPQVLKDAGVEGAARLRFVVDTLGHVELSTVQIIDATHPMFAEAVRAALPRMHFTPARVGDRRVRQLVEFPIQFTLNR